MKGVSLKLFQNADLRFDYEVFDVSNVYRFDNPNNYDISGAFTDLITFADKKIYNNNDVLINTITADINKISMVMVSKSKWKPLNKVIYKGSQFVALGDVLF